MAGLGWYGLIRTPARQTYLNERNLRALRTRSAQIKAKVDNFDTITAAQLKSLPLSVKCKLSEQQISDALRRR